MTPMSKLIRPQRVNKLPLKNHRDSCREIFPAQSPEPTRYRQTMQTRSGPCPVAFSGAQRDVPCQCSLLSGVLLNPGSLTNYSAPGVLTSLLSFSFLQAWTCQSSDPQCAFLCHTRSIQGRAFSHVESQAPAGLPASLTLLPQPSGIFYFTPYPFLSYSLCTAWGWE